MNSEITSFICPVRVAPLEEFLVSLTFKNTGTEIWINSGTNPVRLGSSQPRDNNTWRLNRVDLNQDVNPQEEVVFSFVCKAPGSGGSYTIAWELVQEGITWFGSVAYRVIYVDPMKKIEDQNDIIIVLLTRLVDGLTSKGV